MASVLSQKFVAPKTAYLRRQVFCLQRARAGNNATNLRLKTLGLIRTLTLSLFHSFTLITDMRINSFRRRLLEWYGAHKRSMPWRGTRDPYRVWVSEVMLQQTRVAAVVGYYRRFLRRFPTVRSLARAPESEVLKYWAGLGYYRRARDLHRAAREIVAKHGGRFPREFDAALALPGVGRYTAGAVLSIAYDAPYAALDGNVARVLARLFAVRGDLRSPRRWRELQSRADKLMPKKDAQAEGLFHPTKRQGAPAARQKAKGGQAGMPVLPGEWNQAMMELGAAVCTPRAPRCRACPVARWCRAHQLGIAEEIPAARRKPATVSVKLAAAVLLDGRGRTLLLPLNGDPHDGLFSRMWQFPAVRGGPQARELLRQRLQYLSNGEGKTLVWATGRAAQRTARQSRQQRDSKFKIPDSRPSHKMSRGAENAKAGQTWIEAIAKPKRLSFRAKRGICIASIRRKSADSSPRESAARNDIQVLQWFPGDSSRHPKTLNVSNTETMPDFIALQPAKHTVTFREVTLHPFLVRVAQLPQIAGARTPRLDELEALAVSSATRKIARRALEFLATET